MGDPLERLLQPQRRLAGSSPSDIIAPVLPPVVQLHTTLADPAPIA